MNAEKTLDCSNAYQEDLGEIKSVQSKSELSLKLTSLL